MNSFLVVLEAGKSKVTVPVNLVPGDSLLPGLQITTLMLFPHTVENDLSGVSSHKDANPMGSELHPYDII